MFPRIGKRQTRRACLHVDPNAVAEHGDLVREEVVDIRQCRRAEAGRVQRLQQTCRILSSRVDEDVQIERSSSDTVQDGGDPPDDDVPNVVGGEGREYAA